GGGRDGGDKVLGAELGRDTDDLAGLDVGAYDDGEVREVGKIGVVHRRSLRIRATAWRQGTSRSWQRAGAVPRRRPPHAPALRSRRDRGTRRGRGALAPGVRSAERARWRRASTGCRYPEGAACGKGRAYARTGRAP